MPLENWSFRSRGWFCKWMINSSAYTLQFITVDDVIHMVSRSGAGVLMAKFNVEVTFQNIAFTPLKTTGMRWRGQLCVHLAFPFAFDPFPLSRSGFYSTIMPSRTY